MYAVLLHIAEVRDAQQQLTNYIGLPSETTRIKQQHQETERRAHFDTLTGVSNRLLLADRLSHAMAQAQRNQPVLALCYLDLDDFKHVNDRHGHDVGAAVLMEIVQRIQRIIDFSMPGLHVVELVRALRQAHPTLPVRMLSVHGQPDLDAHMMALGGCGFLTKSCHPETLLSAVREVARGELFLEPRLARHGLADLEAVPANHHCLSQRERQMLHLLCQGNSVEQIGQKLQISSKTVCTHKLRVLEKLGVAGMAELMR